MNNIFEECKKNPIKKEKKQKVAWEKEKQLTLQSVTNIYSFLSNNTLYITLFCYILGFTILYLKVKKNYTVQFVLYNTKIVYQN